MATKLKKTSVQNRTPNTFTLSADGDVGINTHDGKVWVSNGSVVHEVGANIAGDAYIGGSLTHVRGITFDTENPAQLESGTLTWNTVEDCLDIRHEDGSTLQTGLESYIRVRNHTGQTIPQGTLVQFSGVNGDANPTCAPLLANSTFDPLYTIGVLTNDIPHNSAGKATVLGKVRQLDTTGAVSGETWAQGDILWASTTQAGKLTKVKPTAPYPAISVAAVVKTGIVDGELLIRPLIFPRLYYGTFSSNTTQTANSTNTAYSVVFNKIDFASGHTLQNNSQIVAVQSGLYNYQFSLQLLSGNAAEKNIWIWAAINGNDVADSTTRITKKDAGVYSVASWNFVLSMNAGDYFELKFAVDNTNLSIPAPAATAFAPATPASLISVTQVNQ